MTSRTAPRHTFTDQQIFPLNHDAYCSLLCLHMALHKIWTLQSLLEVPYEKNDCFHAEPVGHERRITL